MKKSYIDAKWMLKYLDINFALNYVYQQRKKKRLAAKVIHILTDTFELLMLLKGLLV